jgi:hypothetical protein
MKREFGEYWLTFHEAVEIITSQCRVSTGKAEAMVREALASGEIRYKPTDGPFLFDGPSLRIQGDDDRQSDHPNLDLLLEENRKSWFSTEDFSCWLNRKMPSGKSAQIVVRAEDDQTKIKDQDQGKRGRAKAAIEALWPDGVPEQQILPNKDLIVKVVAWLKDDCERREMSFYPIGADTILRAAGRKN